MQDFIVIQKIVPALGSEAEFGMGNSFIFCLWNMEFFVKAAFHAVTRFHTHVHARKSLNPSNFLILYK